MRVGCVRDDPSDWWLETRVAPAFHVPRQRDSRGTPMVAFACDGQWRCSSSR